MNRHPVRLANVLRGLLVVISLEVFIGGGGRLFEIGPLTLRMVLFAIAVSLAVASLAVIELDRSVRLAWALTALAALSMITSAAWGFADGATSENVMTDMRQLLYFAICPFFALAIRTKEHVVLISVLVKRVSIILAVSYLLFWAALALGLLDFHYWYAQLNDTDEFFFRGELFFFYKGFFYLCIGVIFYLTEPRRLTLAIATLLFTALLLTLTRGFLLFTSIVVLGMLATRNRRLLLIVLPVVIVAIVAAFSVLPNADPLIASQRLESNSVRIDDAAYFFAHVDWISLLTGRGFGIPLNDRLNIENTYLWLLYKQGIPGLLFWGLPFWLIATAYRKARRSPEYHRLADAFFFSTVFLFLQTATNPFLNNSIGMAFLFMSLFSLRVLADTPGTGPIQLSPRLAT